MNRRARGAAPVLAALLSVACGDRTALSAVSALVASPDAGVDAGGDAAGGPVAVLFGGDSFDDAGLLQALSDTWTWDGASWTRRLVAGPAGRSASTMAAFQGKLVLFGGTTGAGSIADTWTWDGMAWTELHVVGPSARSGAVLAPLGGRLFLFGGAHYDAAGNAKTLSDTWAWDGRIWTELPVAGPPARELAVMAPLAGKLFLFSGRLTGTSFDDASDTWSWDGTAWTQLDAPGPSARDGAVMAPMGDRLVLYGGTDPSGDDLTDTWTWDGAAWSRAPVRGPVVNPRFLPQFSGREYAAMAPLGGNLVVFGGEDHGNGDLSDTWVWDGVSWRTRKVTGPRARESAVMATR